MWNAWLLLSVAVAMPQVPVIDNKAPLWKAGRQWTVGARPIVDIGTAEGEPEYELAGVSGVIRLGDGRVAVANMQANEIRFYDRTGKFIKKVGRRGEGPGEFSQLMALHRMNGDSIIANDSRGRYEVFSDQGDYVREFRFSNDRTVNPMAWFANGMAIVGNTRIVDQRDRLGTWIDSIEIALFDARGNKVRTVGTFKFLLQGKRAEVPYSQPMTFGPRAVVAAFGGKFYYNFTDDYEIDVFSADGSLQRRIRRAWTPIKVSKEDLDNYRFGFVNAPDERGGTSDSWKAFREKRYGETMFAETFPAHGSMRVDRVGNLWVQENRRPAREAQPSRFYDAGSTPIEWSVFNPDGRWLGQVTTPAKVWVFDIGDNYITGLWRDEFDVEHARVYPLIKPR